MNKNNKYVILLLLNVEFENRLNMVNILVNEGIKWIYYDVMDGKFVLNLVIELDEIKNIYEKGLKYFKDVYLMVENFLDYIDLYKDVVDIVIFYYEVVELEKLFKFLK